MSAAIDLRTTFGLQADFTERTCIVVAEVRQPGELSLQMGLIVVAPEAPWHIAGAAA